MNTESVSEPQMALHDPKQRYHFSGIPVMYSMSWHIIHLIAIGVPILAERVAEGVIDFVAMTDFLQLPDDVSLGACSAVDFDSKGRLNLFHREKRPILCFDQNGRFLSCIRGVTA